MDASWNNEFWANFFDYLGEFQLFFNEWVHTPFGCMVFVAVSVWTSITLIRLVMEVIG